ncbi:MAG: gloB [Mycobacterium sp.]|jgi:glyoxylase-like metal-dependent hydrolase (beta-lactamase superfamily II)|nr:gloB [Mycobacterium sp.]
MATTDDRLYFRQLLSGRDFAANDVVARQMRNFAYLIGDRETRDAVVVDPAYAAGELVDTLEADGMRLSGVLVTHHHPDHVGGSMMGFALKGLAELLERVNVPVHVNTNEAMWVARVTGIPETDLTSHEHGDKVDIGDIEIELLHTPGHTPGSQCFLLDGCLVAGDTLFLEGCGRTDFPGGSVDEMYRSLHRLADLPGDPRVFPGHWYSAEPSAPLSEVRRTNYVFRPTSLEQWRMLMGGA